MLITIRCCMYCSAHYVTKAMLFPKQLLLSLGLPVDPQLLSLVGRLCTRLEKQVSPHVWGQSLLLLVFDILPSNEAHKTTNKHLNNNKKRTKKEKKAITLEVHWCTKVMCAQLIFRSSQRAKPCIFRRPKARFKTTMA